MRLYHSFDCIIFMPMKFFLVFVFLKLIFFNTSAQTGAVDSLRRIISKQNGDSTEVDAIVRLGRLQEQFDSGIKYADQALSLAEKINYQKGIADAHLVYASVHGGRGNFSQAIQHLLSALDIYTKLEDNVGIASANLLLQGTHRDAGEYR